MKTARENSLFTSEKITDSRSDRIWKFSGGALLWGVIAVVLIFSSPKGKKLTFKQRINNFFSAIFCLLIGVFFGGIFVCIPTIGSVEINFILAPIVQIIVLWLIIESPKSKTTLK